VSEASPSATWLASWSAGHGAASAASNSDGLGALFDAAAAPFGMDVDARTMENLGTTVGFDASGGEARIQKVVAELQ